MLFFFLMIRRPPRSTLDRSSAASDVYKRQVESITKALSTTDVLMTAIKGLSFGSAVAAICCYHGLAVRSSFTEVPQQTTRAMINSFVLCLLIDVVVTVPLYL
mgnify:CR=1 FL=1